MKVITTSNQAGELISQVVLNLKEFEQLRSGECDDLSADFQDKLESSRTLAQLEAALKEGTELHKLGILTPEVIEQLRQSKKEEEELAYKEGFNHAQSLIKEDPDFRWLAEFHDNAQSFYKDEPFDLTLLDLDNHPNALKHNVINGFFDAMEVMYLQVKNTLEL